jgi:hypothetical protein
MLKQINRNWNIRDEATLYDMMRLYDNVSQQFNPFYEELTENFDFTVSELQWDKAIRAQLEKEGRPAFSYNLIRTVLNVIFSIERDNRKKGKASPRTGGDTELANVITQTLQYYLYHAGFSKAQKRVFMDKVVARLGVYHLGWRYNGSEDEVGSLFIESVDPRGLAWELNYDDTLWERSAFVFRKHEMSVEEILNTFALKDPEMRRVIEQEAKVFFEADPMKGKWISRKLKQLFSAVYETATGYSGRNDNLFKGYLQWWNPGNGKFDVLEMHEKRMEKRLFVKDRNRNKIIDITDSYQSEYKALEQKEFAGYDYDPEIIGKITDRYQIEGEADVDLVNRRFVTAVVPAFYMKVNEQPYPFECKYYNYIPEYCYDTHADPIKLQSVIDDIKDPQRDFNKARSLILELLARYANKGWVMDENAISGLEEDWTNNRITQYRRVRSGYMGLVKPEEGQIVSPELIRMPGETQQLIKVITNADDEVRGNRSPGVTSGKHFIAKEERQAKSFTMLLENRDDAQKAVYEQALAFVQHYVTTQQVVRITTDIVPSIEEDQEVELNKRVFSVQNGELAEQVINDVDAYQYDIEITDEPYSASAQEERYSKLGDVFNAALAVNPKKADAMLPIMVRVAGTPEGEKILEAWKALETPPPDQQLMQQVMQKLSMIMANLDIKDKKAEVEGKELDNVKKAEEIKSLKIDNVFSYINGGENKEDGNNGKQKQKQPK